MTDLPILLRDAWVVAVDKPAGLPTQATRDPGRPHLAGLLHEQLVAAGVPLPAGAPWVHHRLDALTSGVVLLSLHPDANAALTRAFRDRLAHKVYRAVCARLSGSPPSRIDNHLGRHRDGRRERMIAVRSGGQRAITTFEWIAPLDRPVIAVRARPLTGRMHQLRVHLASAGFPILGDSLYGDAIPRPLRAAAPRLMLHAERLTLPHPVTGDPLDIEASVPDVFRAMEHGRPNASG